jgi:hypothetical protein
LKTNHLGLILGLTLLPGLTACSTNTLAHLIENTTATPLPKQKAMTLEEEKMIETIKDIFKAMAEPGITPKALAKRFGELDPKYESGLFSVPSNKSFTQLQVTASVDNSNMVSDLDLQLASDTSLSARSLREIFGNYKELIRLHRNSPKSIMFDRKLPELQGYICSITADYSSNNEEDKDPKVSYLTLSLVPDK